MKKAMDKSREWSNWEVNLLSIFFQTYIFRNGPFDYSDILQPRREEKS